MLIFTEKVDFQIKEGKEVKKFPLVVNMEISKEQKEEFEQFKKSLESEYKELEDKAKEAAKLNKKLTRLNNELEDISDELEDIEVEIEATSDNEDRLELIKEKKVLRRERKKLRAKIREIEEQLEAIEEEYPDSELLRQRDEIIEKIEKKRFELNIAESEEREKLVEYMQEKGISYSIVVGEILRLKGELRKKKKRR